MSRTQRLAPIRVSPEEIATIRREADRADATVSELVRGIPSLIAQRRRLARGVLFQCWQSVCDPAVLSGDAVPDELSAIEREALGIFVEHLRTMTDEGRAREIADMSNRWAVDAIQ